MDILRLTEDGHNMQLATFCRDIPVLSASDITNNTSIMSKVPSSPAPGFREDISCMRCHVTMDLAARTTRNVKLHPMTEATKAKIGDEGQMNYEKPALYHQPNIASQSQIS